MKARKQTKKKSGKTSQHVEESPTTATTTTTTKEKPKKMKEKNSPIISTQNKRKSKKHAVDSAAACFAQNGVRIIFSAVAAASSISALFRIIETGTPYALVLRFLTNWSVVLHIVSSLVTVFLSVESIAAAMFERPEFVSKPVGALSRISETIFVIASSLCIFVSILFWSCVHIMGVESVLSPEMVDETLLMHQQHTIPFASLLIDALLFSHTNYYGLFKEILMSWGVLILYILTWPLCNYVWSVNGDSVMINDSGFCGTVRWPYPFLEKASTPVMIMCIVAMLGLSIISTFISISFRAFHTITTTTGRVPPPIDSRRNKSDLDKQD